MCGEMLIGIVVVKLKVVEDKLVLLFVLCVNIDVGFGNNFCFKGYGVDLGLCGMIIVMSVLGVLLCVVGNVCVIEGLMYMMFGCKFVIENGFFMFNGLVLNLGVNIFVMWCN